jgi:type I restriction enzyme S subunit
MIGDIVFARRGELGRCALVTASEEGWICGTGSLRLRLRADQALPAFLAFYLTIAGVREWLELQSVGATMQNLNTAIVARVPVVLPPLNEQESIARYVEAMHHSLRVLINRVVEAIDRLNEYRTGLITAAVTGQIDVRDEVV